MTRKLIGSDGMPINIPTGYRGLQGSARAVQGLGRRGLKYINNRQKMEKSLGYKAIVLITDGADINDVPDIDKTVFEMR